MYKAEHNKMYQEANQGLIEIRKAEIDYYMRVNSAIGTQAALILGFTYLTFTQNIQIDYVWTYYFNVVYFIFSAVTMALGINVVLCTMLIQLLGPGLALNGPIGSMAKATEGMKVEQEPIMKSFFAMMISFSITTTLVFWVAMDFISSVVSTAFFFVAARYWMYYCNRIYLRFYWDREAAIKQAGQFSGRDGSVDEPVLPVRMSEQQQMQHQLLQHQKSLQANPMHDIEGGFNDAASEANADMHERASMRERRSLIETAGRESFKLIERVSNAIIKPGAPPVAGAEGGGKTNVQMASRPSATLQPKEIAAEGFVNMNLVSELKPKYWERRYITLNFRAQLSYYKTRQDYRADASGNRINPRPLELDEYFVSIHKYEVSDTASMFSSSDGGTAKFMFSLSRKDDETFRHWYYRTDTEEELDMWTTALKLVSPSSFKTPQLDI